MILGKRGRLDQSMLFLITIEKSKTYFKCERISPEFSLETPNPAKPEPNC